METIQIPAVIRPALKAELFGERDTPIRNAIYFVKKHKTNELQGVFYVHGILNVYTFIYQYIFRELHVIVTEGEGFCFLMNLRLGDQFDVIDGRFLRINYSYYILESDNTVSGPHKIANDTDPFAIAALITSKSLYVVDENQSFQPYQIQKSA